MFSSQPRIWELFYWWKKLPFPFPFPSPICVLGRKDEKSKKEIQKLYLIDLFIFRSSLPQGFRADGCFNQAIIWLPLASPQSYTWNLNSFIRTCPEQDGQGATIVFLVVSYLPLHPFPSPAVSSVSEIHFYSIVGSICFLADCRNLHSKM